METSVCSLSLDQHRKYSSQSDPMNKEWTRLLSYANFPVDSVVSGIRLAQAGFYYTGSGEEVICFCCGVRNGVWTEDETVLEVHQRLSPGCMFIYGGETTNIAIHGEHRLNHTTNCSKSSDIGNQNGKFPLKNYSEAVKLEKNKESFDLTFQQALDEIPKKTKEENSSCVTTDSTGTINGHIEIYPGIRKKPKCPDFVLISERLASFAAWPKDHVINPTVLAEAGFYYVGIQDCVRCFFCYGGMKNWQEGDNPWIEHARWFPNCSYIQLCKGKSFVNFCCAEINAAYDTIYNKEFQSQLIQENIPDDWMVQNINSSAAKLMMSKGYNQEDVENGILFARRKYGTSEIKTKYIMEYFQQINTVLQKQELSITDESKIHKQNDTSCKQNSKSIIEKSKTYSGNSKSKSEKQRLLEENLRLKDLMTCKVCSDSEAVVAFLPCGHLISCEKCAKSQSKCEICRKIVQATVRVYSA